MISGRSTSVWDALGRDPREVAALWLESPGRRLLQELRTLRAMPGARRGATDLSLVRIHRAAGVEDSPSPSDMARFKPWSATPPATWRAVHLTAPGASISLWSPASGDTAGAVHALDLGDEGSPASVRGAALAWLLARAREAPQYEVGGITRDLRDELPARLADALAAEERTPARAPAELEEVALAHATRIQEGDRAPGCVFRTWAVAHWLAGCVWRSPFFGGDEPTLVARLRALLPSALAEPTDALDPRWFRADGLRVSEVALVGGALAHPARIAGVASVPPSPLVRTLRRIAERPILRPAEVGAEELLAQGKNELGWSAPHVAPPLAARFWLTERQIAWLAAAPVETQQHVIDLLARHPARFGWACFAVMEEGAELAPSAKQAAAALWPRLRDAAQPKAHERCAFGVGVLAALDDAEAESVIELAMSAEGTWPPFLLDILAKGAEKGARSGVWSKSIHKLLGLAEDRRNTDTVRLNAALFVAWRTSSKMGAPAGVLDRLAGLSTEPPFLRHSGLQRELRRRGLPSKKIAGGER